jgi:formylmethanofuran dehydrogenase subunit D
MEAVVTVVTFEDIFQSEAEKKGKYSEDYRKLSAQIILDKQDMVNLGVKEGQNVLLRTMWGVSSWSPRPLRMIHIPGWHSWSAVHGRIS